MALLPPVVAGILQTSFVGQSIAGVSSVQLSTAISFGFCQYVLSTPIVGTQDVGSAGAGVGTGVSLTIPPSTFSRAFQETFTANGIKGTHRMTLIRAISVALSQSLLTAQLVTAHAGTAVGTGVVIGVLVNSTISVPMMVGSFIGVGLIGSHSASLATAIAQGVDHSLPSAKGQVVIAGPSAPSPGGGRGYGKIV